MSPHPYKLTFFSEGGGGSCILEIMDILPINALQNPARSLLQHNTVETVLHYHTLLSDL